MAGEPLEKTLRVNLLFDFYEPLLTEKQRAILTYYYHDDDSLGEISELLGVSRQAVYEHLKRAEKTLEEYERKLGLVRRHEARRKAIAALREALRAHPAAAEAVEPYLSELERLD
ncbi:MAG: hypothetical protein BLM47_03185 [Candidatus Reconcilbacillus cellulovorans]|uniref:UPF0122 protein BLM47_03185 n=1 Tax=Candidatus Reconcilbacillus cellulovorans TaxID=1906605 RepID=A0A2A6E1T4_9BACL|nr:MAG: hypothetical protein BLM47_03185 [Candidatus Reconcilbacillus cellulovorans]